MPFRYYERYGPVRYSILVTCDIVQRHLVPVVRTVPLVSCKHDAGCIVFRRIVGQGSGVRGSRSSTQLTASVVFISDCPGRPLELLTVHEHY